MNYRKFPLKTGHIYHVFTRSIADFKIFNNHHEFIRMRTTLAYYQIAKPLVRLSHFRETGLNKDLNQPLAGEDRTELVQFIAYCLMPTHLHLILKQLVERGITIFAGNVLNSYARYFNIKHKRKGPLWETTFKNVPVETDEQLLHLTRYVHLNPTTANLTDKPEDWPFSSYGEYLQKGEKVSNMCQHDDILNIQPDIYKKFVEERIGYQKELATIKKLVME